MELLQLKYFQTVARYEHITHAAEELHIAQPSLSKIINRLEEDLGVNLFDRQGRHIKLNQYGKAFLHRVERIFMEIEDSKQELMNITEHENFKVSISTNIFSLLPKLLEGFLKTTPQASFRQTIGSTVEMRCQLENREIDFCISSPLILDNDIECIPLENEEFCLIVPQGHKFAGLKSINLSEAANEPFISLKEGYEIRDVTERFCYQAGFTPNVVFEGDIATTLLDMVNIGAGITLLPVHKWMEIPGNILTILPINEPTCSRTIGLSFVKDRYLSKTAILFKEHVIDYFKYSSISSNV